MDDLSHLLVFTDLDGTLLGHHDYRFEVALPLIQLLQARGATVVLATSKTDEEVKAWQSRLQITGSYIVENGSAVHSGAEVSVLGTPISDLEKCLEPFSEEITRLDTCSSEEVIALTGLSPEDARLAQSRLYSVPFQLKDSGLEAALRESARVAGYRVIKGGRFLHLQGMCDKGDAAELVRRQVEAASKNIVRTVALGDNENDKSMLENADAAVVLKTDRGHQIQLTNSNTIYTEQLAPEGWCEGLGAALASLGINTGETDG